MNRKGQALVEFVLILPVIIFILFAIIDFGRIFSMKNTLVNDSFDIIQLYKNGTNLDKLSSMYNDFRIDIVDDGEYYRFNISVYIDLITPGLNKVLGEPYEIVVERVIPYA